MIKRLCCLILCLTLLPVWALAENVEDSLIIGMLSTKTTELRPLTPKERDIISLYGVIYESLVTIDDNGIPQPLLAETWAESNGGKPGPLRFAKTLPFRTARPLPRRMWPPAASTS